MSKNGWCQTQRTPCSKLGSLKEKSKSALSLLKEQKKATSIEGNETDGMTPDTENDSLDSFSHSLFHSIGGVFSLNMKG